MSALWPVQVAMVTALKAAAGVKALVGDPARVYDGQAPQGAAKPYIVVGDHTEAPSNALGRLGWSDTITAHVFSDYAGTKEALAVVTAMDAALAAPLTISGHGAARLKPEFGTVLVEDEGVRHAPRRYRVTTMEN
jgi:hypothetical protein